MSKQRLPTVSDALSDAADRLSDAGIESARREAEWLLSHILGTSRTDLLLEPIRALTGRQAAGLSDALRRRCARTPLQHILGTAEFYGRPFRVSPDVLIPRPETESVAEAVIERLQHRVAPLLLDVGTGAGAIAVTLACERPDARCVATDVSPSALAVAADNARRNDVSGRVHLVRADLLTAFRESRSFDCVVSNPPYIRSSDVAGLQPEVRDHDPRLALDGGADGLSVFRRLLPPASRLLRPAGLLVLEMGDDQTESLVGLAGACHGLKDVDVLPDLSGRPRILIANVA